MQKGKFLFGAALGAAAAALLTPVTGKKARQKMEKTAKKISQDDRFSKVMSKSEQIFDKAKTAAKEKIEAESKK